MINGQENVIEVRDLTKSYRLYEKTSDRLREVFSPRRKVYHTPFTALQDLSFSVAKGESIGIIGRNGSGKSTLLQILCNILAPTSGTVTVNGRISALLELGAGFNPEYSGRDNVYMNSAILGLKREEVDAKIDEIAAFAEIGDYIDQPVKMYSSGMYVRLAFAAAISVEPEILVVDEALAVGDIFFQQKCIKHMKEMMSQCTILFVTHDMHMVTNLCERVILLDKGRKIFEGGPLDGVSKFTKLVHSEGAEKSRSREDDGFPAQEVAPDQSAESAESAERAAGWLWVPESAKGGVQEVDILRVRLTDENGELKSMAEPGDVVVAEMVVATKKPMSNLIFGYTLKDRIGNAICGENTMSSLASDIFLERGTHRISLRLNWPEIYPDTYTITFGVGQGDDPFAHTIHCWAHNILAITGLKKDRGVHGIFNNPITEFQSQPF